MTMTRAWWIVAAGMILVVPGARAIAAVNHLTHLGPALSYAALGIFCLGLATAVVGIVQVALAAARAVR